MTTSVTICEQAYRTIMTDDPERLERETQWQPILPGTKC